MDDLDQLSENIEREALVSLHEHCPPETRAALGLRLDRFGDALAAIAEHDPSILINRTVGFGTTEAPDGARVAAVARAYRDAGVGRFFFHAYEDDMPPAVMAAFGDSGLERVRGWMKFHRSGEAPIGVRRSDLEIRKVGRDAAADFGTIVAAAFGMTPEGGPLLAGLAEDPRWHLFVSYDGDNPAGAGALFVHGDVGWLEWGATDPAFRRRGSQGAIMAARLAVARDLGCRHVFTETGEAVAGDPQHSYGNIERAGFVASRLRQNFAPTAQPSG